MRKINVTLALLMMFGAGIAGAVSQTAFTAYVSALPQSTLPLTGSELVAIQQGGAMKQVSVTNLRSAGGGNFVTISGTPAAGNCVQWASASSVSAASGGCVVPGPAPFLMAQ